MIKRAYDFTLATSDFQTFAITLTSYTYTYLKLVIQLKLAVHKEL